MPRKPTGSLVWMPSGWHGRYYATVDSQRKYVFEDLGTKNEVIAKRELAKRVAAASGGNTRLVETFEQAAARVNGLRAKVITNHDGEAALLVNHVNPVIGRIPAREVRKADVLSVLEAVRDCGLSQQTIIHVRNAISAVYRQLRREGAIDALPIPSADELPECLPDANDDRPKAILSDEELLIYLGYTEPREGERFRGAARERQLMALLARCVGGMRAGELHGLTWARVDAEGDRFEQIEVVRYKVRRKASRRGSKATSRQLYPLGDTCLPLFLRFWHVRTMLKRKARPDGAELLFPVRRARRAGEVDNVGGKREGGSLAKALRRDVASAFQAARKAGDKRAPAPGSERWRELIDGTENRRPLWFHSTRNMAAVAVERLERLKASARFTGHASVSMLQHYREMAGEVDVVPIVPELLPDDETLKIILHSWCEADGVEPALVFGEQIVCTSRLHKSQESPQISAHLGDPSTAESADFTRTYHPETALRRPLLYPTELRGQTTQHRATTQEVQGSDEHSRARRV